MNTKAIPYYFHDDIILRTPLYPIRYGVSAAEILDFFKDPIAAEALYIASPVLYYQYQKWLEGQAFPEKERDKLLYSLTRYYYRMHMRCTPFGLLASVSMTKWGEGATNIVVEDLEGMRRKNRLDMYMVCSIQEHLLQHQDVLQYLDFYPNSSIYPVGEDLRYIEYKVNGELRNHQITSVTNSEYIELILDFCKPGVRLGAIADMLTGYEIEWEEGMEFLLQLADAQLLVSELEPNTTGEFFFDRLYHTLKRIRSEHDSAFVSSWIVVFEKINALIATLDGRPENKYAVYQEILGILRAAGLEPHEAKLIQSDTWRPVHSGALDRNIQEQFKRMMCYLNPLHSFKMPTAWSNFIQKFSDRYEAQEVPLARVLDDELGLGFGDAINKDDNPATADVAVPGAAGYSSTEWTEQQGRLFNQILDAYASQDYTLRFSAADVETEQVSWDLLPPSMAVIFRQVENNKLLVETVGNASAANLIGRFAYLHEDIQKLVVDICETEQKINDEVIFAEVVHLPGSRVGNILLRPVFRQHEIAFLARPGVAEAFQLPLDDLLVSVRNGRIVLRSQKLNKYVIPKLTTAHNYHYYTQPLYKFLCDLQNQDFRFWLTYSLSDLGNQMVFAPRVEFENIILSPATWFFTNKMIEPVIKAGNSADRMRAMQELRLRLKMPRFILLQEADIEMLVDTEDPLLVDVLISDIKNRGQIIFREHLASSSDTVRGRQGETYANQFICTLMRNTPVYQNMTPPARNRSVVVQRDYLPGENWLYYKAYAGLKTMDNLLADVLGPLAAHLKSQGWIEKWFFIRYADPDNHLRFRFWLAQTDHFKVVNDLVHAQLRPYVDNGQIWKIQLDTYRRELERYGTTGMEMSESLFDADSTATTFFIGKMREHGSPDVRWMWAMKTTDALLTHLGFGPEGKTALMGVLKTSFAREFRMENSWYLKQFSRKYREQKDLIRQLLLPEDTLPSDAIPEFMEDCVQLHNRLIEKPCLALKAMAEQNELDVSFESLVASHIHMKFNRIFPSYQRKHELVLYDLLYQAFKTARIMSTVQI